MRKTNKWKKSAAATATKAAALPTAAAALPTAAAALEAAAAAAAEKKPFHQIAYFFHFSFHSGKSSVKNVLHVTEEKKPL